MDLARIKRFTFIINTVILGLVIALAGFFLLCKAEFLCWFSIPTILVYVIGYFLIKKEYLEIYVRVVYFWITLYMCLCTIFLGYKFGFHLYCLSMIPIIFYTEYMADKLNKTRVNAFVSSGIIGICYLLCTGYSEFTGPVYTVDNSLAGAFWAFNSVIVLAFLVFYSRLMLSLIGDYEKKLTLTAHTDRLTGLYNRHFMMTELESAVSDGNLLFVAMIDIDDFKKINDTYGHNAGDYVLVNVSRIMHEVCGSCRISRWGGEEFLILSSGIIRENVISLAETLRKKIASEDFVFGDEHIRVTITTGLASYNGDSVDNWIKTADENLYTGKKSGKNRVVI